MASNISKLSVMLTANTAKFERGMSRARKKFEGFRQHLTTASLSIGASVGAAVVAINKMTAALDETAKAAKRIGVSVRELRGLQFAANLSGLETNILNKSLERMVDAVGEAAKGSGEASAALNELGVNAKTLNDLSPEQQFIEISAAVNKLTNNNDKLRIFMDIFGRKGASMLNLAKEGAGAIRQMAEEGKALGAVSDASARAAERYQDSITRLTTAFEGLFNATADSGALDWVTNKINSWSSIISRFTSGEAYQKFENFLWRMGMVSQDAPFQAASGFDPNAFAEDTNQVPGAAPASDDFVHVDKTAGRAVHSEEFLNEQRELHKRLEEQRQADLERLNDKLTNERVAKIREEKKALKEKHDLEMKQAKERKQQMAQEAKEAAEAMERTKERLSRLDERKAKIERKIEASRDKVAEDAHQSTLGGMAQQLNTGLMALNTGVESPRANREFKVNQSQLEQLKEVNKNIAEMNKKMNNGEIALAF